VTTPKHLNIYIPTFGEENTKLKEVIKICVNYLKVKEGWFLSRALFHVTCNDQLLTDIQSFSISDIRTKECQFMNVTWIITISTINLSRIIKDVSNDFICQSSK